jgi:hypothetical protein
MTTILEIEIAIERLPAAQVDELASWLEAYRTRRTAAFDAERWLNRARGAAVSGVRTADVMALTRGEE